MLAALCVIGHERAGAGPAPVRTDLRDATARRGQKAGDMRSSRAEAFQVLRGNAIRAEAAEGVIEARVQTVEGRELTAQKRVALSVEQRQNLGRPGWRRVSSGRARRWSRLPDQRLEEGFGKADPPLRGQCPCMFPTQQRGELILSGAPAEGAPAFAEARVFQHFLEEVRLECAGHGAQGVACIGGGAVGPGR